MGDWATVVGTLGGAVIGAGGTWAIEHSRRRLERSQRWSADIRSILARVIAGTNSMVNTCYDHVTAWGSAAGQTGPAPEGYRKSMASLSSASSDLAIAIGEADMLVEESTRAELKTLDNAVRRGLLITMDTKALHSPEFNAAMSAISDARRSLGNVARAELRGSAKT